jgi:hypothetical protein
MKKLPSVGKFHFEPPFTSFDHLVGAGEQFVGRRRAEHSGGLGSRLLLLNERLSRRPDSRDLNYHLTVFSP